MAMGFLTRKAPWALGAVEDRTLTAPEEPTGFHLPFMATGAPLNITTSNVLAVSDAYACVRLLADSISSLPLHVYRKTPAGRVRAGNDQRAVQLLNRPSPGSTRVDLISQIVTHLNVFGECFIGKYRSDNTVVQLGLIHPESVQVELRGQRIVYTLSTARGLTEHGPDDILHIKGMSLDGLRGLSPVAQCRVALGLSSSLQASAKAFTEHGSRPSGILTAPGGNSDALQRIQETWASRHAGAENMHKVAVVAGEIEFKPIAFTADDNQFLQQREMSAREVARCFRVPAWSIDAGSGDSMTYSNVTEQNRALVTHSLRPWIVRIETAITNDSDLCPGGTYCQFELDGLLRAAAKERAEQYTLALAGWMTRAEVRELEDLPPEENPA